VLEYRRQNQSTWTSVTPVSKTLGTYVSGGIVASGSLAGRYEVDFPDAAFASAAGVEWVELCVRGVANMLPVLIEIELDAVDYQDAAAFGLSRIDQTIGSRATQTSVDTIDDFIDTEVAAIKAKTDLIVAFPANFGNLGITPGGGIAELGSNALLANDLYTPIANAVAATQALSRLDSMIESDGAGQFRFDTIAVSMVAGGAGGTDWNTNERTAFRTILGFNSAGDILDPSSGILDTIRDKTALITAGGTVNVTSPVTATGQLASPLIIGDDYLAANGRRFRWTVELPSGYVIATSTARFGMRYEDDEGVNEFVSTGTVTDATGGNVYLDFDVSKTVTGELRPGWYEWSVEIVSATGTKITRVKSGKNVEWQEKQT
jgi:hypothetical protein